MICRFRSLFRKKKNGENNRHSTNEDTRNIARTKIGSEEVAKSSGVRKQSIGKRRTSDSISNDPVYLNKLFGIRNEGKIRLFNEPLEDKPEQRPKYMNNLQVYTASVARNSTNYKAPRPSEPFPYSVYNSVPRRSTLHYGVDDEGKPLHSAEQRGHSILKGGYDNAVPNTSQNESFYHPALNNQDDRKRSDQQGRRVTIATPDEIGDMPFTNNYENEANDLETDPVRKTVLRFRPHSSASRSSRESAKLMVLRADLAEHPPMVLSRHVHDLPLKKIKHTPVLMTDDGRVLKPLDTKNQTRNSFDTNKEESHIRLSMADIENVCKAPRKSTAITNPVLHSRNSMSRRNSIRQSLVSRQIENEKRNSILRGDSKILYQYNLENEPTVYNVPVIPSRNRPKSLLSRQSVTSYNLKELQRHDNEGTPYYEHERNPIDKGLRYSRGSYQPDCIIMKKDKPIVVYEVNNFENNNRSISKNSIIKDKDTSNVNTKPKRKSGEKSIVTNQPTNPQVQTIYQAQPNEKNWFKNKLSFRKSSENYMNESCPTFQQQPVVYAAEVPSAMLPAPKNETRKWFSKRKNSKTSNSSTEKVQSKDFCGLTCEPQDKTGPLQKHSNSVVSTSQQTDFENDIDYLCYPAEKPYKTPNKSTGSNSKLKWRIIVKKQEDK